ncbi:MAG: ribonuclease J [Patescibacteria group bacterium]
MTAKQASSRRTTAKKKRFDKTKLKIIFLGGLEEVGRNMMLMEYGSDIIIIDMGLQFPEEDMPGIDYIIPDISYLKGKESWIRGVIITHGHYDHIGGIPHLLPRLGMPPIYTGRLSRAIIEKRQTDYNHSKKIKINTVNQNDTLKLGIFKVGFFHVNHNIPDCLGVYIDTPVGRFLHTGDFKFDHSPVNDPPADIAQIAKICEGGIVAAMVDSTNADQEGNSISEKTIFDTLDGIFDKADGRIIAATFSSLLSRIQQIFTLSEKYGRKVIVEGYSMKTNVEIAIKLGYLKVAKNTLISIKQLRDYPNDKITIMCTGAQGEDNAVLMRIANKEHRQIRVDNGDTIIFSSSVVPGNERSVQGLKDVLFKQGAKVIHYKMMDVHTGGHARQEDLKMMFRLINPKYYMPIEGNYFMLKIHADLIASLGMPPENIFVAENGQVVEVDKQKAVLTKKKVPTDYVMVDGLGVGDVGHVVLRDRQMMAADGMFVVIAVIDKKRGGLARDVDVISRGFVYMKGSDQLIQEAKKKAREIINRHAHGEAPNWTYIRNRLRDDIGQFLFKKTQRRPMVLPVVTEI